MVTTMAERRQNLHQARVGNAITPSSGAVQTFLSETSAYLQAHGLSPKDAVTAANVRLYEELGRQTQLQAFMDCFAILAAVTLIIASLALLVKRVQPSGSLPEAH